MDKARKDVLTLLGGLGRAFGDDVLLGEPGSEMDEEDDVSKLSSEKEASVKKDEERLGSPHKGH